LLHCARHAVSQLRGHEQVYVIGHQHIGMNFGRVAMAHEIQQIEVSAIVIVVEKRTVAIVAPLNNVKSDFWNADAG
jgi:hypothetical protein